MTLSRRFRQDPLGLLLDWQREYGDVVHLQMGPIRFYWLFHPDLVHQVLVSKSKQFRRTGRQVDVLREWDGDGLVTSDGDHWARQRRLVQPAFSSRLFSNYARQITNVTSGLVDRWLQASPSNVEMNEAMTELTLQIMASTFFGADLSDKTHQLGGAVAYLSDYAFREIGKPFSLPNWIPLPRIRRKLREIRFLNDTLDGIIHERRAKGSTTDDVLSMLLQATDDEGDGNRMTDEQVRYEAMTLFLAGHDTTAGVLPWIWYLLAKHPEVEAGLVEEVTTVLAGRLPAADDLPRLSLTKMVIQETLRLYPQAYVLFARVAATDLDLGDYKIKRGSQLFPVPYVIHHDARWHPDPERFDPDRFGPERIELIRNCSWIPFGAGPRACIGAAFAMMEMTLIVATIAQRAKLSLAPNQHDLEPLPLFSLRPKGGLRMSATSRHTQPS